MISKAKINEYAAYLYLKVTKDKNRDEMAHEVYYTNFYRSSKPLYLDEQDLVNPCFQLITMGGGFVSGEVYRQDFEVGDNARCILTTQSSSKTYKAIDNKTSVQHTNIKVGKNAILEYVSDNLIVYENGRFAQYNEFHVENSSTLIYSECFGPGWSPLGAAYMYDLMYLNTKIYYDNKLVLFDNLKFTPSTHDESAFGIMDGFHYCGTMVMLNPLLTEQDVIAIRDEIKHSLNDIKMSFGVSLMEVPGIGIRVLADTFYNVDKVTAIAHKYVRQKLWNKKPLSLRKL
ncbi:urease accessory protein UreD [Ureaplasma diversum]|uniref:Urease accessory protein UreD n=1 Tax=Ureaplasma diversum TaxID=42094 RepID=A0A0C5RP34_9BACT|nr:urease accessory protein UreD [Ureaplasma diversum]AJQ45234.1 urease accessory protein UreD [Ureaplasma diversum]